MVNIAIINVANRTPLALSSKSYFKKIKNTIRFKIAPRLINLVIELSINESLIIFNILASLNKTIIVIITPKKFAKKPLNNPKKTSFLFN